VVMVGTRKALAIAVGNSEPQRRYTRLRDRLTSIDLFSDPVIE
jgi:hypothetical protein